jgi:hypothetical protein
MSDEVLVTIQMRFPAFDRRVLAEHIAPVVAEALAAGGNFTSISTMPFDGDEDDE